MKTIEISIVEEITLNVAIKERKNKIIKLLSEDDSDEIKNYFIGELSELVSIEKKVNNG